MMQIRDLNFLTFWLSLGNQHFGSKTNVNTICLKNNGCIGYKHSPRHLLRPKKLWFIMRKFFWFEIIWVCFGKIDFRGLFGAQILSLNPGVQSKRRYTEKYWIFQKFKKVALNELFFWLCCLKINSYHFNITVLTWYDVCIVNYSV